MNIHTGLPKPLNTKLTVQFDSENVKYISKREDTSYMENINMINPSSIKDHETRENICELVARLQYGKRLKTNGATICN